MYARINEFQMAYDDRGEGIPVLMIHGYPLNREMWAPQREDLSVVARAIIPDLRGHGESGHPESSESEMPTYSMDLHAQDCADLLDLIGVNEPVVVCGLSMGGYISFSFLRRYPERVRGLILCATRAGADSAEGRVGRDKSVQTALESGPEAIAAGMLPKMLAPQTYETKPELVERVKKIMESTSTAGIVGDLLGMKERPDSIGLLGNIQVPTLILYGENDQIIPGSEAELMHTEIPNASLVSIPESGHLLNLEQPDAFNREVSMFLDKID
jgi:pimeloyl-ACP methyl ester carboxylesterase